MAIAAPLSWSYQAFALTLSFKYLKYTILFIDLFSLRLSVHTAAAGEEQLNLQFVAAKL